MSVNMTKEQYELLLEAFYQDIEEIRNAYDAEKINGEAADNEEREVYERIRELEREYAESLENTSNDEREC